MARQRKKIRTKVARAVTTQVDSAESNQLRPRPVVTPRREDLEPIWSPDLEPDKVITAITNAVEHGAPADLIDIFDRARRQDLVLRGIIQTRLIALRCCPWEIVANPDTDGSGGDALAKEARDLVKSVVSRLTGMGEYLTHQSQGVIYGVAVTEIMWKATTTGHTIDALVPVPHKSLFGHHTDPWRIVIPTSEHDHVGTPLTDYPRKFITHCPELVGNSPWGCGLFVAACMHAVMKIYGLRWFAAFAEKFGSPYVWATYGSGANAADRAKMATNLSNFGYDGYGMAPNDWELEFIESMRSSDTLPQPALMDRLDKYFAIGMLGQELTTQTSSSGGGAYALGQVHENVRQDIRQADAEAEATTIQQQLFKPIMILNGLGAAPVPLWVRRPPDVKDREAEGRVLDVAVNTLGMKVTNAEAYEALGYAVPKGVKADAFLEQQAPPATNPFDAFAFKALTKKKN